MMTIVRALAAAIAAGALLAVPAGAEAQTLTKSQAARATREAVRAEFDTTARVISCKRASRLQRTCRARWRYILRRYTGTVAVRESGPRISPVIRYSISGKGTGRYLGTRRVRRSGRVIAQTRRARLGQTLRLLGNVGTDIEVTLGQYIDSFPAGEFEVPAQGTRYVGVPVTVTNKSSRRLDDSLSNGARLITTDGETLRARLVSTCTDSISATKGESRQACVAFEVPFTTQIRQVEYQPSSGFGRETGVWR